MQVATQADPTSQWGEGPPSGEVVVGFDGGRSSKGAMAVAVREASDRGLGLLVLSVVARKHEPLLTRLAQESADRARREQVKSSAVSAAAAVSAGHAALHVEVVVVDEPDLDRLSGRMSRCRLLVLGDHGTLGVRAFLLGSTSFDLVRSVGCPVLVVPDTRSEPATTGDVLVGVGTATDDVAVLRVAGQEAVRRQAALVVLHSYARAGVSAEAAKAGAGHLDSVLDLAGLSPDLPVTTVLTADPAEQALLEHGRRADLTVVGTRGSFALARLANDSVSRHVLDAAPGPVLVVPPGR